MTQTRLASMIEAVANVAAGFILSFCLQVAVSVIYDLNTSLMQDAQIVLMFTCLSLVRSYILRRLFNRYHV